MRKLFFIICLSALVWSSAAANITLKGRLKTDEGTPVLGTRIAVSGGPSEITDSDGNFQISLSSDFIEGEQVILKVFKEGWVMNHPLDGEWNLPNIKYQNVHTTDVILVPYGSKALWSHARIEKYIAQLSDEIAKRSKEGDRPQPIDFTYYLKEWAEIYGFSPQEVKFAFDEWANTVEDTANWRTLGLREYYRKNFKKAAENFEKAALQGEERRKALQEQLRQEDLATYENWKDAGNALYTDYQFAEALEKYKNAGAIVSYESYPHEWAKIQNHTGLTEWELGIRVEGKESRQRLANAVASYQNALQVFTPETLPRDWAMTQNNLGLALQAQGIRTGGEQGVQLFSQAVKAFRAALTVYTREEFSQQWALIQNNLGAALADQGIRSGIEQGAQLLSQAVDAFRAALTVRTREVLPRDWALTKNNLGTALQAQGIRSGGEQGVQLLSQAVDAYRAVLTVRTREELPQDWALTQNNLGVALQEQGIRSGGEQSAQLLSQAVNAFRAALTVYTHEVLPQGWAMTQNNLGLALQAQGIRSGGEQSTQLLSRAVTAYRAALTVYTREELPQDWARTQNNFGNTLFEQGIRSGGEQGIQLLSQALDAYRAALTVYTRTELPQDWARTQNNFGNTLFEQGIRTNGEQGAQLLSQAVDAYRAALTVRTHEVLPRGWARTQNNLGNALFEQGIRTDREQTRENFFREAENTFRNALEVCQKEILPDYWAQTQNNLGELYEAWEKWEEAVICYRNISELYPGEAAEKLSGIYQNRVFRFEEAFEANRELLNVDPRSWLTHLKLVENHFTAGNFVDGNSYIGRLRQGLEMTPEVNIILNIFEIANYTALQNPNSVRAKFDILIELIQQHPPDYKLDWTFTGTKHFTATSEALVSHQEWLLAFFSAFEEKTGTELVAELRRLRGEL